MTHRPSTLHTLRAFLVVGVAFGAGLGAGAGLVRDAVAGSWTDYAGLDAMARAIHTIQRRYVEPVPPEALAHAAIEGMADHLDRWSHYHPPERWAELAADTDSDAVGIGAQLEDRGGGVEVVRVVPEGPADLAGLAVGMTLTAIDGTDVRSAAAAEAALNGKAGTPVSLTVGQDDAAEVIVVVRDSYLDVRVDGGPLGDGLHYLRIGRFTRGTADRVDQELSRATDLDGLVLDLRSNPGGLLSEATAIADRFLTDGLIVETRDRDGAVEDRVDASSSPNDLSVPVVVLINGHSASAAEVLAGALQARRRARLVGSPSFGKGAVQQVFQFEDGGALRITVARYHLAEGRTIDAKHPLQPDVAVALKDDGPRARLARALAEHAPDAATADQWARDLAQLDDPALDLEAPAPIPVGAAPIDYLGHDPVLDAAVAELRE